MIWPHAGAISAEMINVIALRDWSDKHLVSDPMRTFSVNSTQPNLAIAASCLRSGPEPAIVVRVKRLSYPLNKPVFKGSRNHLPFLVSRHQYASSS
jgi:hypothetical protein